VEDDVSFIVNALNILFGDEGMFNSINISGKYELESITLVITTKARLKGLERLLYPFIPSL
jgi:hypothetical protein